MRCSKFIEVDGGIGGCRAAKVDLICCSLSAWFGEYRRRRVASVASVSALALQAGGTAIAAAVTRVIGGEEQPTSNADHRQVHMAVTDSNASVVPLMQSCMALASMV